MLKRFGRLSAGLALMIGALVTGAGLTLLPVASSPAGAAITITVTTPNDTDIPAVPANCAPASVNPCTLRDALAYAESQATDATISLTDNTYQVLSTGGQLDVNDNGHTVTITGEDASGTILQAQCTGVSCSITTRVLKVETGTTADVSLVTIEDGDPSGGVGGGILNCGTLDLSDSYVTSNTALDSGGGIEASNGASTTLTSVTVSDNLQSGTTEQGGGGIYVVGDASAGSILDMSESTVQNNTADGGDGGGITLGGTGNVNTVATIDSTDIFNNTTDTNGGGLAQDATSTLNLTNSTVDGNTSNSEASINGGGLYLDGSTSVDSLSNDTIGQGGETQPNSAADGGGVYINATDPTFTNVTITDNDSEEGGGVYIVGGTNTFTGGSISDNNSNSTGGGGVYVDGGTNSFSGVAVTGNTASNNGNGGGFYIGAGTNTFNDDSVDDNTAVWTSGEGGGGGFWTEGGTQTFTGGDVSNNHAYIGGGIFIVEGTTTATQLTVAGNTASEAGGGVVVNDATTSITTTITDSTISGNTANGTVGFTAELGDGGGILDSFCNTLVLTNDTIVNNIAGGSGRGGGYEGEGCDTTGTNTAFLFDTVADNTAGDASGGGNIQLSDKSSVTLEDTIVAGGVVSGTPGTNCAIDSGATATFNSLGYNLIDDNTCGTAAATDLTGQNPQLGSLANNGGPTETLLPADGSPEVGAIPDATCVGTGVGLDQRGVARGAGANSSCTIGAVEVGQNFNGYRLVANEGGIFDYGLLFSGSLVGNHLNAPIVGLANAPGPAGYVMVGSDGGVFALGGANFYGSLGGQALPSPIAAIAAPPTETGYWLVAQNGKIYNYGSVPALPALSLPPGAHIVGMASTTDGLGAWLTDNLGDVYAEGSAQYKGGLGGVHLNKPIVGIAAAASGQGYVLVASDGGVFNYGTQNFFGSVPGSLKAGQTLNAPIVGIAVTHSGNGYWEVGSDGGVFTYGDAPFLGSMAGIRLNGPVVGIQHLGAVSTPA